MKNKQEILKEMLSTHYPKSWEAITEAVDEAVSKNQNKIVTGVLAVETQTMSFDQKSVVIRQFQDYLKGLGFAGVISQYPASSILYKGQRYSGYALIIYISEDKELENYKKV